MLRSLFVRATTLAITVVLPLSVGAPGPGIATAAHRWSCIRRDNGAHNPGPNCGPYRYRAITDSNGSNTYVLNDMWNPPGRGHPQTIRVNNPGDWEVTSDQARGNTAVLSYPSVQQIMTTTRDTPAPLRRFAGITGRFSETMPHNGDNEAAYDIWMGNGQATNYAQEVMIWVDDHRTNSAPGRVVGRPRFSGARYTVWQDRSGGSRGYHTLYMVRDHNEAAGTVHIRTMLRWLIARHLTVATGLNQIDFGWEICSTAGRPETFVMHRYSLRLRCHHGGSGCYA